MRVPSRVWHVLAKTRICLASELYSNTQTDSGVSPWVEMNDTASECHTREGTLMFQLCGPATLEAFTGMNCDGTSETLVHTVSNTTAATCHNITKPEGGYWNSFK